MDSKSPCYSKPGGRRLPTLALKIKDEFESPLTIESLATQITEDSAKSAALFMHYYKTCVRPAQTLSRAAIEGKDAPARVLANYRQFLQTTLQLMMRRKPMEKRCNVFTTNYDPCFAIVADEILQEGNIDFVLNDGTRGFTRKLLEARNFNTYLCQTGIFERDQVSIPQINLIHLHGSVHWRKSHSRIVVDYMSANDPSLLSDALIDRLDDFSQSLLNDESSIDSLVAPGFIGDEADAFMSAYNNLPIVNPTKWKFHETVFEEHYYQMLRLLSYELEKPNSVLVTFGFSFADEHILNLVKRSLSNPRLQVFICCYDSDEATRLGAEFAMYANVRLIAVSEGLLDFSAFNSKVLSLKTSPVEQPDSTENSA